MTTQKIITCLCYDSQAEEAVNFYLSIFKNAKILSITRCGENEPSGPAGSVRTISFRLFDQEYLAVNGGSYFKFNDGISLMVNCESQAEIDELWERLSAGGEQVVCGWLKDKFGVPWQIVPTVLSKMMADPDQTKSQRVMQALLKMKKLDIKALQQAYEQA